MSSIDAAGHGEDTLPPEGIPDTPDAAAGAETRTAGGTIPKIIRAAGERAVEQYRAFLESSTRTRNTQSAYRTAANSFFDWANHRGFSLGTITGDDANRFADELAKTLRSSTIAQYLGVLRAFFGHLAIAQVVAQNPFDPALMRSCRMTSQAANDAGGFPLLALMAMLANMEEESLSVIFEDEETAIRLLDFVRWRDEKRCTHCEAVVEEQTDPAAHALLECHCPACGRTYSVTDGSPFEGLAMPLRHALYLLLSFYLGGDPPPDADALRDRAISESDLTALRLKMDEALASRQLTAPEDLRRVVARKDREMTQDEIARDMIEYGRLEAAREELMRAKADGSPIDGLPAGMTVNQALADIEARIAEHDRHVILLKDGYLITQPAEPAESEAASDTVTAAAGPAIPAERPEHG